MGSDFTNDDLVRESSTVDDYEHQILREEEYSGRDAWVLELIPNFLYMSMNMVQLPKEPQKIGQLILPRLVISGIRWNLLWNNSSRI
ncbi:hypothetical protein BH23BAC3_BH23BAC3_18230 [soil metagenome]